LSGGFRADRSVSATLHLRGLVCPVQREARCMDWLLVSLVASLVLTIALNVALRVFRGSGDRASRRFESWAGADEQRRPDGGRERRVVVFFPWKTALIASLVLTILLNVVIRLV
jgi:hypothetical protein